MCATDTVSGALLIPELGHKRALDPWDTPRNNFILNNPPSKTRSNTNRTLEGYALTIDIIAVISPNTLIEGGKDIFKMSTPPIIKENAGLTLINPFVKARLREPLNM